MCRGFHIWRPTSKGSLRWSAKRRTIVRTDQNVTLHKQKCLLEVHQKTSDFSNHRFTFYFYFFSYFHFYITTVEFFPSYANLFGNAMEESFHFEEVSFPLLALSGCCAMGLFDRF